MSKLLKRLVIDSATKYLYISLHDGTAMLNVFYEAGNNDHSVKLMSEIEKMLNVNNLSIRDLDEIIVGIGPGSYTGLRIGVAVAKIFGWNDNITVKTISSLALLASSSDSESLLLPEVDARRGNSFLGVYKNTGEALELIEEEQLTNLSEYINDYQQPLEVVSVGKPNINKIIASDLLVLCENIHSLAPNYLRLTEAEQNKR